MYSIAKKIAAECKYTCLSKLISLAHFHAGAVTPGPGTYRSDMKNTSGAPILSDHKYRGTPIIKLPSKAVKFVSDRQIMTSATKNNPGPGAYKPSLLSKSIAFSMCGNERSVKIFEKTTNLGNPGPGSYVAPSDFGYPSGFKLRKSSSRPRL